MTAVRPVRASRIRWRVHLALTVGLSLGIAVLTLAYRYYSGEWSRGGLFLGTLILGAGSLAWLLRPRGPAA